MSVAKDRVETKSADEVDPFLESVVRSASGRPPEPKAPGKIRTEDRPKAAVAGRRKAGATKTAAPSEAVALTTSDEPAELLEVSTDTDDGLMARVEAKLKSGKIGVSRSVTIRMPGELYDRLMQQAWDIGERSLSKFVITILEEATQR